MAFIDDFRSIKDKTKKDKTQTQLIFEEVLKRCNLTGKSAEEQYNHLYDILAKRDEIHNEIEAFAHSFQDRDMYKKYKEDVSVTGGVTELICEIALKVSSRDYEKLPKDWEWVGDFAILGTPFNAFISVKSYKAKERLIASGTGQNAAPVIGYGLFDDPCEWSPSRTKQYKQRGFIAIYMPKDLYNILASKTGRGHPSTKIRNIYDKPLLRKIEDLPSDLKNVCIANSHSLDLSKF